MSDIWVRAVDKKGKWVKIQIMNVEFTFVLIAKNLKIISKRKPSAQVHDPAACWVPAHLFNSACRRAVAILSKQSKKPT